jgi:hypothetical protein
MTTSIYPKSISSWTDRIDGSSTVWAADPNELASEIIAIEQVFGTQPNIEGKLPVGNPVTYSTVGARISDTLLRNQAPYVSLTAGRFTVPYYSTTAEHGRYISFNRAYDSTGKYFNGSDITIPKGGTGLYIANSYVTWDYYTSGYVMSHLIINGVDWQSTRWDWDFPTSGPDDASYKNRWATTAFTWMGKLTAGTRVRVIAENGTAKNPYQAENAYLDLHYLRALPS